MMRSADFKTTLPDIHTIHAKKVVIAGAGPVGLIAAIMLAEEGVDVTVVDSWMGECTRAHDLAQPVLKIIAQAIYPLKIYFDSAKLKEIPAYEDFKSTDPYSVQFKDVEKQLFDFVKNSKVTLIKKQFYAFDDARKILLIDKDAGPTAEKMQLTGVDIFIDCTGVKRHGLKSYNNKQLDTSSHFIFKPLIKKQKSTAFSQMRVISTQELFANVAAKEPLEEGDKYFLYKEKLEDLGWKEVHLPLTINWPRSKKNSSLIKNHIYMELPLDLPKEKISETYLTSYATFLTKLTSNKPDEIKFELQKTKKSNKRMFGDFVDDPQQTTPAFMLENKDFPFITHMGDASKSLSFYTAMGLSRAIVSLHTIISKFFNIEKGMIKTLQTKDWLDFYEEHLAEAIECMSENNRLKDESKAQQLQEAQKNYYQAYLRSENPITRQRIAKEYKKMDPLNPLPSYQQTQKVDEDSKSEKTEMTEKLQISSNPTFKLL